MELKSIKKKFNRVLALVLMIAALAVGQSVWAASTFTVTNTSGTSKFVITRTSNTSATETVNYRTVSLSAIAGQHFTDKTGTLTFDAIHNSREVEVTENTPGTDAYKYQNGTSRKYRFEVLDQGGFRLAYTDRTITTGTSVPSSNAFAVKDVIIQTNEYTADDKGYDKNGYKSVSSSSFFTSSNAPKNYLKHIGAQLLMTLSFQGKENDDAYEYLQLLFNETTNCDGRSGKSNGDPGDPNLSSYMAGFEMNTGTKDDTYRSYTFPILDVESGGKANDPWGYDPTNHKWPLKKQNFKSGSRATDGRIIVPMDFSSIVLRLNASGGSGSDEWAVKNVKAHIQAVDGTAPSRLGNPVISGSTHAKGNTFYVSVPFDEIVTVTGTPTLSTTWGSASYVSSNGGSGSNVLTFSGTITASAGTALTVSSISGTIKDLAGNELSSAGKAINKNIGITVDANHSFTITYDLADGTVATANPDSYTYETATFTLKKPIRAGYTFAGWTGSNGNTLQTTVTIPAGSHGDKTFTANWTPIWGQDNDKTGEDEDHAYVISSTAGLDMLAKVVNGTDGYTANTFEGKFFKLGADITYTHISDWNNANSTENNYTAIGRLSVNKFYTFMGTFDGDGYTVSGIRIYKKDATDANSFQGLFGRIGEQGIVRNITLDDSRITGNTWSGGIAGNSDGTVDNCHVTDQVLIHTLSTGDMHGGIAGRNSGLLQNSTSAATLSANSVNAKEYGGIAGFNLGTVQNCLAVGTSISSQNQYVGAIVGVNDGGTLVSNYYRNCTVGGATTNVGIGWEDDNETSHDRDGARSVHTLTLGTGITATGESVTNGTDIYYISNTTVTLNAPTGYVISAASYSDGADHNITGNTFTMPASDITVSATLTDLWDITSGKDGTTAEKAYTITSTAGLDLLATLVNGGNNFDGKYFKLDADITYTHTTNWNDATSTENNYTAIGGYVDGNWRDFCGTFDGQGHTVRGIRIYKGGTTTADDSQGLFGSTIGATIRNVILADARITGRQYVGGIAGYIIVNAGTGGIVENCRVGSDVTIHAVADYAFNHGGVVGDCNGGTISGCVTSATLTVANGLTSITYYGGIVGNLGGNMSDCLSIDASVPDVDMNGAIAGEVATNRTLTNNYYYNCTVGGATTNVGIGAEEGNTTPHDRDGARSVHSLTLPDGVTDTGESVTIGTDIYYISNTTVTLNAPTGYVISAASYSDGADHNITGNTFTMPAADVTVSATLTDVWGIASGKDGTTAEKAYTITSTAGLDLLATLVNGGNNFDGKYFKLGADITYTNTTDWNDATSTENNFTAIGVYVDGNWRYFGGTFDGQNHTVRGIRIYKGGTTNADGYQGLFGRTIGATIRNVILADARITGKQNVGGIAGYTESAETGGIVENCRVGSDVTIHAVVDYASYHGGVVGDCNGTISGCVSSATLTLANDLTGINSYGGIVGGINNIGSTIENCLALGAHVPALVKYYGIITGENESNGTSTGILTANYYHGCTVGTNENAVNVGVGTNNGSTDKDGARCVHSLTCGFGVTATPGTVESVTISGVTYYASGSTFTLAYTGTPATGHRFTGFNATAGTVSGDPTNGYTFAMAAADAIVNARIEEVAYIITYDLDGGELSGEYRTGYSVTTPTFALPTPTRTGYTFAGWTGTDLAEPTLTVIVSQGSTGDRSYSAHWTAIDYTVYPYGGWDGWAFEHGTVTPDKITGVHYGDVVTLAVTQEVGYLLKTLTVVNRTTGEATDITADENGRYAFTMPASNVDVYAEFAEALTVVIDVNIEHGTVTASPTVAYEGQTVTLTVTPDPGYELVWLKYGDYEWDPDWEPLRLSFEMPEATYFLVEAEFRMTWARLNNAMQNGGTFTLTNNVTAADGDGPLSVPEGKTVTLDLNGHTLNRNLTAATASGSVIEVNGTLTLNDGSASGTGTITGGNSTNSAGGVDVDGGTFTMNGGTISNNTAGSGGGVYLYSGTFTMNGGSISNNDASFGGGVYVNLSSTFTMNGGSISNNDASFGGVAVDGTFNVSGNPVITGNTKMNGNANNVYLKNGKVITVTGALTNAAHISVTTQTAPTPSNPVTFTSGLSGNGTVANFTSDNGSNIALINGEAALLATHTVTFLCGNGSGTMETAHIPANTDYTIPACGFTAPEGMMFVGWVSNNGWTLSSGEELYMNVDYTLTAVFHTYHTVTITGDGANGVETEWLWEDASHNYFLVSGEGSGIRFPEGASLDFYGLPLFISSTPALNFDESGMYYSLNNVTTDVSISLMAGYAINLNGSGYESGLHAYARSVADDRYIVTSAPAGAVVYIIGTMDGGAGAVQSCTATGHTSGTSYDVSVEDFGWAALGFDFTMPDEAVDANLVIGYVNEIRKSCEHGNVTTASNSLAPSGTAFEGDIVTLTVTPDPGYALESLTVIYQDYYYETHTVTTTQGTGANANQYTFTMPNERVDVNATFTWINPMELRDNADNTALIAAANGMTGLNVTIQGRTFKGGKKQTICLPFDPSHLLTLGTVWAFTGISEGKIVMTEQTGTLAANTPYIFQATNDASNVEFSNVTIVNSDDPKIVNNEVGFTFRGTYTQKTWEADDAAVTGGHLYGFMMQDNDGQVEGQFVKARRKTILRPFSCYLEYNGDLSDTNPSSHAAARSATRGTTGETPDVIDIVWVSANGTVTGISRLDTRTGEITDSDDWYLMDGRKLNGKPTVKGLYINNGKVVIIK